VVVVAKLVGHFAYIYVHVFVCARMYAHMLLLLLAIGQHLSVQDVNLADGHQVFVVNTNENSQERYARQLCDVVDRQLGSVILFCV
jgi:signal transduction histidine kinase